MLLKKHSCYIYLRRYAYLWHDGWLCGLVLTIVLILYHLEYKTNVHAGSFSEHNIANTHCMSFSPAPSVTKLPEWQVWWTHLQTSSPSEVAPPCFSKDLYPPVWHLLDVKKDVKKEETHCVCLFCMLDYIALHAYFFNPFVLSLIFHQFCTTL